MSRQIPDCIRFFALEFSYHDSACLVLKVDFDRCGVVISTIHIATVSTAEIDMR